MTYPKQGERIAVVVDSSWPTISGIVRAAEALDMISGPKVGDVLRAVADGMERGPIAESIPWSLAKDVETGIWTDDEGRQWVPARRELPDEQGAVILWENGAHLRQFAQYNARLGWRFNRNENDPRWLKPAELQKIIGNSIWQRYVPEPIRNSSTGGEL